MKYILKHRLQEYNLVWDACIHSDVIIDNAINCVSKQMLSDIYGIKKFCYFIRNSKDYDYRIERQGNQISLSWISPDTGDRVVETWILETC